MMRKLLFSTVSTFQLHLSLLLLRLGIGALMLTHGWPKLMRLLEGGPYIFPDPLGMSPTLSLVMATVIEVVCSLLIMLGLVTRLAAFALLLTMGVAVLVVHAADPFAMQELGILYILVYLVLTLTGGGKFSLDNRLK